MDMVNDGVVEDHEHKQQARGQDGTTKDEDGNGRHKLPNGDQNDEGNCGAPEALIAPSNGNVTVLVLKMREFFLDFVPIRYF
jgi:hypothetical protein